jgi:hypothetical protein
MARKLRLSHKLLFSSIILVVAVVAAEIGLRIVVHFTRGEDVVPSTVSRHDEKLGWSLRPNSHASSSRTGYRVDYRINSKGLRGRETSHEKPDGVFRIVLLGDSRTFGYGVPIEKHFSSVLEGWFDRVEVINLGVSGYGIDQELLRLRSEGFQYDPDLVITYVAGFGDKRHINTWKWGREKPKFELTDGELVLTNSPVPPEILPGDVPLLRHLKLYNLTRKCVRDLTHDSEDEVDDSELDVLAEALIAAMHKESIAKGAEFVLVTQVDQLHKSSIEAGLHSLDVTKALDNPTFPLSEELQHVNEAGNGVLAWQIAQFLVQKGLIPEKHLRSATQ